MKFNKSFTVAMLFAIAILLPSLLFAATSEKRMFINTTGVTKDTLKIYFNKAVNAAYDFSANISPFTIKANANANKTVILTGVDTTLGDELAAGDTTACMVAAIADTGTLKIDSIKWSGNVKFLGTDTLTVIRRCGAGSPQTPTPFLGTRGIIVLLLLLAATAWFVLSRRKVRTTGSAA